MAIGVRRFRGRRSKGVRSKLSSKGQDWTSAGVSVLRSAALRQGHWRSPGQAHPAAPPHHPGWSRQGPQGPNPDPP